MNFKIVIGLLLFFCSTMIFAQKDVHAIFKLANEQYEKGNYEKAADMYQQIVDAGWESSELYFNLGNAFYRMDKTGLAILNYEKAKKLAPQDGDISNNLELVNLKTEDKIESAPDLFLSSWLNKTAGIMNEKMWSVTLIILFISALLLLSMYLMFITPIAKKIFFYSSLILLLFSLFSFLMARRQYIYLKTHEEAVIVVASTTVKSAPGKESQKLFILHEGTKVKVLGESSGWMEIELANGNVGWLPEKDLREI